MMCEFDEQTYLDESMTGVEFNTVDHRKPTREKFTEATTVEVKPEREWLTLAEHEAAVARECHATFSTGGFLTVAPVAEVVAWLAEFAPWCDIATVAQCEGSTAYVYGGA